MLNNKKIVVVLPAYNAAATLKQTCAEIPREIVDQVILVDDGSKDQTVKIASELGLQVAVHEKNLGYGGNQKTCYRLALDAGADVVVMLHPDYQYSPKLIAAMAAMVTSGHYDIVMGSRILGGGALLGGMPPYKYVFNRLLTASQNLLMGTKLSEFHTGYRAFTREVIESLPLKDCSNDFVFDNQMLGLAVQEGFRIGEISCPTRYFEEASSINFFRSVVYGLGVIKTSWKYNRFSKDRKPMRSFDKDLSAALNK
jgi:glycosyltransferase involved in cell wall biosynthesis